MSLQVEFFARKGPQEWPCSVFLGTEGVLLSFDPLKDKTKKAYVLFLSKSNAIKAMIKDTLPMIDRSVSVHSTTLWEAKVRSSRLIAFNPR